MRKISFVNNHYYHIYNRGVDKRRIFLREGEYIRFLFTIKSLLKTGTARQGLTISKSSAFSTKLSFVSYCLMPNHYHFLLKQKEENGISDFMHRLNTSYTKYFNISHKRTGRLFEYTFKAVGIETDEQLIHLSRYIHLNPFMGGLVKTLNHYKWSSYPDFIGKRNGTICEKEEILDSFKNNEKKYEQFVLDNIDYAKSLKTIQKLVAEKTDI